MNSVKSREKGKKQSKLRDMLLLVASAIMTLDDLIKEGVAKKEPSGLIKSEMGVQWKSGCACKHGCSSKNGKGTEIRLSIRPDAIYVLSHHSSRKRRKGYQLLPSTQWARESKQGQKTKDLP